VQHLGNDADYYNCINYCALRINDV